MRVGGPSRAVAFPRDATELRRLLAFLHDRRMPFKVVGKGANLLVPDEGYDGVIVILGPGFSQLERDGDSCVVDAGAGMSMARFAANLARMGIGGFEWAAQIAGTLGGGIVNNAGAFHQDFTDQVIEARVIHADGREEMLSAEGLGFKYRHSSIKGTSGRVLVSAKLRGCPKDPAEIRALMKEYGRSRTEHQPTAEASAGCIFKNPWPQSAGYLIDKSGLKGLQIGDARVSEKHANFIVNDGRATAQNIFDLIRKVRERVHQATQTTLEPEVEILGGYTVLEKAA
jgi:UDP-N-acetylmuramate dehydrogenase